LKFLIKTQKYDFQEVLFLCNFKKIHIIPFTLPVSFFETLFWLGLRLKTPTNKKFRPK